MISDEIAWELWLNDRCVSHMTSSPHELDVLAVGYCRQQGLIKDGQAVRAFYENRGVSVAVVGIKPTLASKRRPMTVTAERLCSYGTLLDELSAAHHMTHGVHEGALVQDGVVLAYAEDVSRYNVLDRLAGEVYLRNIDTSQAVLVFSGRVPQQVAEKASALGVSCIASRAMATSAGIEAAARLGLTLVCALRSDSFRVFAHEERILVK
ncbi:formate dehydrogenase accessory sulfurtransferase FdhD [Megasphaera hexanoica]|uniref:formate dehydrogenase accessory sulfurtransferase FdhD n=1 Tax=Megasphaera stantonii TaxID=2144175 RepID=UPI001956DE6B|nr:formate dehydrogenase accessory sulfurtransferase FdhD [Megasphaera stantonii]MBM6732127.1 formate dehydrogenase accessory sulfurtransferase FdhD [Megasphaera stantonii]MDN0047748.1 formate dehydrogenase accessory sulfurtransferase FdhD [Megasphaera hexanoica]